MYKGYEFNYKLKNSFAYLGLENVLRNSYLLADVVILKTIYGIIWIKQSQD